MTTAKKPTAKQLAARKRFSEMAKNGTLAKKRAAANKGLKKPSVRGLKTVCKRVIKVVGLKVDGTLKKGYKYVGGKVVKVVSKPKAKKPVAKKKAVAKKKK